MVPNKTFLVTYPDWIHTDLERHFIRGYWDGDGFIGSNPKNFQVGIIGTYDFIKTLSNVLFKTINLKSNSFHKERNVFVLNRSKKEAAKIANYLYKDSSIYLERKYNNFANYLKEAI